VTSEEWEEGYATETQRAQRRRRVSDQRPEISDQGAKRRDPGRPAYLMEGHVVYLREVCLLPTSNLASGAEARWLLVLNFGAGSPDPLKKERPEENPPEESTVRVALSWVEVGSKPAPFEGEGCGTHAKWPTKGLAAIDDFPVGVLVAGVG
jgi:hypothetical protein